MKLKLADNSGMILVLTMMMIAVFLSIALGFSVLIISDINKARAIDNSVVAYYAADSGLEESLYLFRKQGVTSTDELSSIRPDSQSLSSAQASWNIENSSDYEEYFLRQRLARGRSAKFFILNRQGVEGKYVKSIVLEWYRGEAEGNVASLQVSLTQLTPQQDEDTLVFYTDESRVELYDSTNPEDEDPPFFCYNLKDQDLSGQLLLTTRPDYLMEIKVLGSGDPDEVETLTAKAYNISCGDIAINEDWEKSFNPQGINNLTIRSIGSYGQTSQALTAYLPPKGLPSSLVGFVLFSQKDIVKESGLEF
jgi:hypothetical protein